MSERMPEMPEFEAPESRETQEIQITDEQRGAALEYLRKSSDSSIGEDAQLADAEEIALAERIASLGLGRSDSAPDAMFDFGESNYIPDVEARKALFAQAQIPENVEIRRHDVVLGRGGKIPPLKVIDLMLHEVDEQMRSSWKPVTNGILFMGKITFEQGDGNATYLKLSEEEKALVETYLKDKYPEA